MALSLLSGQTAVGTATATTVTATYASAPTQDNLLVAVAFCNSGSSTISGWTVVKDQAFNTTQTITILAKIAGAGESTTVTTNVTTNSLKRLAIHEVSGAVSTSVAAALDDTQGGTAGSVTTVAASNVTTVQNDEIVFAGVAWPGAVTDGATPVDSGFTRTATDARLWSAYKIVSSTYAATSPCTWQWVTSRVPGQVVATFKQAMVGDLSVNESETITVTESIARQRLSFVNVSDSVSITENTKVEINSFVSANDTSSITESINRLVENVVSVSDSLTVNESIKAEPNNFVTVSDTTAITESLGLLSEENIVISDSTAITDTPTVFAPTLVTVVSDSVAVSENISVSIGAISGVNLNVSDTATISENVNLVIPELFITANDGVSVTENSSVIIEAFINVSDTVTTTESVTAAIATTGALTIQVADRIGGSKSNSIILLMDGRVAVRLSNNLYQPL